jgi:hypothetical protein
MTEQQPEEQPHVHVWGLLDLWEPTQPYHPQLKPVNATIVLVRCRTCDIPRTIELQGIWTMKQLLKNEARVERPSDG